MYRVIHVLTKLESPLIPQYRILFRHSDEPSNIPLSPLDGSLAMDGLWELIAVLYIASLEMASPRILREAWFDFDRKARYFVPVHV